MLSIKASMLLKKCTARYSSYSGQSYGSCYWCERNNQLGFDTFALDQSVKSTLKQRIEYIAIDR
jgi:hypothetical protein